MTVQNTSLTFTATDQSLWAPGEATILRVDSGDSLIFDPAELTEPIDISLLGFGVEGEFYFDFKIGLFAYAEAPSAGSFSTEFNIDLAVDVTGGVEVGTRAPDAEIEYDIVSWEAVSASIESRGFSTGAKAGLDVILGLSAGIRDMSYFTWFNEDDLGDVSFFDLDERIPLVTLSTNQIIGSAKPSRKVKKKDDEDGGSSSGGDDGGFEVEPYPGISLIARLPSGANTKGASAGELTVEASGASTTRFLELALDLDELIVEFGSKIPGVGAVFKALGETIFAEHVFDINDYISFIPAGKIEFKATLLDIDAGVGAVITEDVAVDISDGNGRPDLTIELVSDNGTAGNTADDITINTTLAQVEAAGGVSLAAPTSGTGRVTLDATYGLQNVDFSHGMGIGLNASVVITALKASLGGAWVPSALAFSFGPLLREEFPEGGLNLDLFNFFDDTFELAGDAFNTVEDSYSIFFTDTLPVGYDIDTPGIEQIVFRYQEAISENLAQTAEQLAFLWDNNPSQTILNIPDTTGQPPTVNTQSNITAVWQGNVDSEFELTQPASQNAFLVIDPLDPNPSDPPAGLELSDLTANLVDASGNSLRPVRDLGANETLIMGNFLDDTTLGLDLRYSYGGPFIPSPGVLPAETRREILTGTPAQVVGNAGDDLLLYYRKSLSDSLPEFFDGGLNTGGIAGDRFVANFQVVNPNASTSGEAGTGLIWNLAETNANGGAIDLLPGLRVQGVESLGLRATDNIDVIGTGTRQDWVELAGGNDILTVASDAAIDILNTGAGDDVILVTESSVDGVFDFITGGTGLDQAIHDNSASSDGLSVGMVQFSPFEDTPVVLASSSFSDIIALLNFQIDYLESQPFADQLLEDDTPVSVIVSNESLGAQTANGLASGTNYNTSVEHISYYGSETAADAILFNGGLVYAGGASGGDLLIGDFGAYADAVGTEDGLNARANGSGFTFGDSVITGFERFVIQGTDRADIIVGGDDQDFIQGADGNDVLSGGDDKAGDLVRGGRGDDVIVWRNAGNDALQGDRIDTLSEPTELGNDTLVIEADGLETHGLQRAFFDGNLDPMGPQPLYSASDDATTLLAALALSEGDTVFNDGYVFDTPTVSVFLLDSAMMLAEDFEVVHISGSVQHDDLLLRTGPASRIDGGETAGDADVLVADFSDQLNGMQLVLSDEGTNAQLLSDGSIVQGIDRAVMRGTQGADTLKGASLDDVLLGGDGTDILMGGAGNDSLDGEAGDDIFMWSPDATDGSADFDTYQGGAGRDAMAIGGFGAGLLIKVGTGRVMSASSADPSDIIDAFDAIALGTPVDFIVGDDTLRSSGIEVIDIAGSDAHDDVVFMLGGTAYVGGERAGDRDVIAADLRDETEGVLLDLGEDTITIDGADVTGFEAVVILSGSGNDLLLSGGQADYIDGGAGNDTLDAGARLTLGGGTDFMLGGIGEDVLYATNGGFAVLDGGDDLDFAEIGLDLPGSEISLLFDSNGQEITADFLRDPPLGTGATAYEVFESFSSLLSSTNFAIEYRGRPGSNISAGVDQRVEVFNVEFIAVTAGAGDDLLTGGFVRGQMSGGAGDDVLMARGGQDLMVGGAGFDTYVIGAGSGADTIAGETAGGGELVFAGHTLADLSFSAQNSDLIIDGLGSTNVRVIDYYTGGANGLGLTLTTSDFSGTFDATPFAGSIAPVADGAFFAGDALDEEIDLGSDAGRDSIFGGGGDDIILATRGSDVYDGGAGIDWVSYAHFTEGVVLDLAFNRGNSGPATNHTFMSIEGIIGTETIGSVLRGSDRGESLVGGSAGDIIEGRRGDDLLIGFEGSDNIRGDDGDDTIFGDEGDDSLQGGDDDDLIIGGDGNDTILGDDGDDILRGLAGVDSILGGLGDDTVIYGGDDDAATDDSDPTTGADDENGFDRIDGGGGTGDVFDLTEYEWAVGLITDSVQERVRTSETDTFTAFPGARDIANLTGFEGFVLTGFNDLAEANTDHAISLGRGDDTLRIDAFGGAFGSGSYDGGDDFDRIEDTTGGANGVVVDLSGPTQTFTDALGQVHAISGFEIYAGTDNNDTFTGSGDDELFEDGGGSDSIVAGDGDDTVVASADGIAGSETFDGGDGFDLIDYSAETDGILVDLFFNEAFGVGSDILIGFEDVIAGSGNDEIYGSVDGNRIDGGAGDDTIYGDEGDDLFVGGAGNDSLDGDFLTEPGGIAGFDIADYTGATSALTIDLTLASGQVSGGVDVGTDTLIGVEGVSGGQQSDTFLGTIADEVYFYAGNAGEGGHDTVDGGGGVDILDLSGFGAAVELDLSAVDAGTVRTRDGETMSDTLGPLRDAISFTNMGTVVATAFGDDLKGSALQDTLRGGEGNDRLSGRGGSDLLDGGDGIDTADYSGLTVTNGISVDISGEVFSALIPDVTPGGFDGQGGFDTFENIENVAGTGAVDFISGDNRANLLVGGAGGDELWGRDGNDTLSGGEDDDRLDGMEGADLLDGGTGEDTMIGGSGDDIYMVDDARDTVTEQADGGIDTVMARTSYVLADHVEGLSLFGTASQNLAGTGNALDNVIVGDEGANVLDGGAGTDTLDGGEGDDILRDTSTNVDNDVFRGGAGNDILEANFGSDAFDGGTGNDTLRIEGSRAEFFLSGSAIDFAIDLNAGSDLFGNTYVSIENVQAGAGDDRIQGDAEDNIITGGSGDDTLEGRAGGDELDGGDGSDTLTYAGSGERVIVRLFDGTALGGDALGDKISGFEHVNGSAFGDTLIGLFDMGNRLEGGAGDDLLRGLSGNDTLIGGTGADALDGGDDMDTASYATSASRVILRLFDGTALGGDAAGDTLTDIEALIGSAHDDALIGSSDDNLLEGGDGEDLLRGLGGNDTLQGGADADTVDGGSGSDTASYATSDGFVILRLFDGRAQGGHAAGDTLTSIENLIGSDFDDTLIGSFNEANILQGGTGFDLLRGLSGDDTLEGGAGVDELDGGDGIDTASYAGSDGFVIVRLFDGLALGGHAAGDVLIEIENLRGSDHADTLIGSDIANLIEGGNGADALTGLGGDDTLRGEAGDDFLYGSDGIDTLDGGDGSDTASYDISGARVIVRLFDGLTLGGDAAGDTLTSIENLIGTDFNDTLIGQNDEANRLDGGADDDLLRGLTGDDTLIGGAGADVIDGGDGSDTASYVSSLERVIVRLFDGTALGGDAAGDTLTSIENLTGSGAGDTLIGDFDADNVLEGMNGDDLLRGLSGADRLIGGGGNDTLDGGGADGARDVFVFETFHSVDVVRDFADNEDRLEFGSNVLAAEVTLTQQGADVLISYGLGDSVLVEGITVAALSDDIDFLSTVGSDSDASDLPGGVDTGGARAAPGVTGQLLLGEGTGDVMTGGFGVDTLIGNGGDDVLSGSAQADVLYGNDGFDFINGGFGSDRVHGGAGADRFFHQGSAGHGSDWIGDYSAAEGDVLFYGGGPARAGDFLVQMANTPGAGQAKLDEAFVTHIPTGNLLWALTDGAAQPSINIQIGNEVFDLMA